MHDPIAIFLIVLGLFSADLFLFLYFLPRKVLLSFSVELVWWCWILLTFACLESFRFLHQIWRRVLLGRIFLVIGSSLSSLWICHSLLVCRVSVEKSADNLMGLLLYVMSFFPLLLLYFLSVFNFFFSLITMSLSVFLLGFIFPGVLCAFWTLTISFPMFRKFSAIVSSTIFSGPFSLSSPSETPIMWMLVHLMLS